MVNITVRIVLKIYNQLLNGNISYSDADRWAWNMMQSLDNDTLHFESLQDEPLIWELITFLYGIDVPDMMNKNITARSNIDIISFLEEKGLYETAKSMKDTSG
jgi:hypothetical protein